MLRGLFAKVAQLLGFRAAQNQKPEEALSALREATAGRRMRPNRAMRRFMERARRRGGRRIAVQPDGSKDAVLICAGSRPGRHWSLCR